ncbi:MAG: tail fiber domain-containing protein [Bdellovibrionales bacterium]
MGFFSDIGGFVEDVTGINMGSNSSTDRAVQAQRDASRDANATQRYIYDQTRADQQPWRQSGEQALGHIWNSDYLRDFSMADFQADPGYQFRMQEGMKALQNSAAAKGNLNSGATLKALTRYGQDFASNEFTNAYNRFNSDRDRRFNRLSSLAGLGQTANAQVGQAGQNYATAYGNNVTGAANAQAAQAMAQARQVGGLFESGATAYAASDERLKTNVTPVSKRELQEMRSHLKAYRFNYKDEKYGEGDWLGVMAQDLEKSKLGRSLVVEDAYGHKMLDLRKVMSLFLATLAEG